MKLPDKLLTLRKENGLSQEELSQRLNISWQTVSRWEDGTARPNSQNIIELGRLYDLSPDELLNEDAEQTPQAQSSSSENKRFHLISGIAFTVAAVCFLIGLNSPTYPRTVFTYIVLALCAFSAILQFVLFFRR